MAEWFMIGKMILNSKNKKMEQNNQQEQNIGIDATLSYESGAWNDFKMLFQQQVPRYIASVEQKGGSRTIGDINGLLSFLETSINNILGVFLKQQISISKLKKVTTPRITLK